MWIKYTGFEFSSNQLSCILMLASHPINIRYPQALHTYRINLSPFTKDFRVWGALIETILFILESSLGDFHQDDN